MQLALETSGQSGSVAVLAGETVLRQTQLDRSRRAAAVLAPEIDAVLRWCEKNQHRLGWISVANGPGSFTGLRIAVAAAKTLSYATALPLLAVDSLAATAATQFAADARLSSLFVATPAYRGQVFCGNFERRDLLPDLSCFRDAEGPPAGWTAHPATVRIESREGWREILGRMPGEQSIAGSPVPFGDRGGAIRTEQCDAVGVGLLGIRAALSGQWTDPLELLPRYFKPSAAEEQWDAR